MLCRPALHKLLKYDKLILVCFWVFYATAAATWIISGVLHPLAVPFSFPGPDVFPYYHLWGALLILIMTLVFPMLLLRDWLFRRRSEKGMREMVEGVSASVGKVFFHSLMKHLSQVLEADFVLIGRLSEKDPSRIDAILAETALEPACLGVEITESAVMEDVVRAADLLKRLKALGVHVSIDDFGTGYSSLGYLKRFPIDMLKIDRSFVMDLPTTPDDVAIVTGVIAMAHNLNIKTLAEGVQNKLQHDFLRQQRCDELQGFLFNNPLPAEEFSRHYWQGAPSLS